MSIKKIQDFIKKQIFPLLNQTHFYTFFILPIIKQYADFKGRCSRKNFWIFALFYYLMLYSFYIISILALDEALVVFYIVATFVPYMAIIVRRLHDMEKSYVYIFILLIPYIGGLMLLAFLSLPGKPHANKWGEVPQNKDI